MSLIHHRMSLVGGDDGLSIQLYGLWIYGRSRGAKMSHRSRRVIRPEVKRGNTVTNFAIKSMSFLVPFTVAAIGLVSAANASYAPDRSASAAATASVQTSAAVPSDKAEKQHCMTMEAISGSRMPKRKCKTIAEWKELGYEFKSER